MFDIERVRIREVKKIQEDAERKREREIMNIITTCSFSQLQAMAEDARRMHKDSL